MAPKSWGFHQVIPMFLKVPDSLEGASRMHNNSPDCVKTRAGGAPAPRMGLREARSGGDPRVLPRLLGSKWERDWRIRGFHTASRWSRPGQPTVSVGAIVSLGWPGGSSRGHSAAQRVEGCGERG